MSKTSCWLPTRPGDRDTSKRFHKLLQDFTALERPPGGGSFNIRWRGRVEVGRWRGERQAYRPLLPEDTLPSPWARAGMPAPTAITYEESYRRPRSSASGRSEAG